MLSLLRLLPLCAVLIVLPVTAFGQPPDILLITVDTLRADRIGTYGYKDAGTPVIDALAAEGIQFNNAVSHVPLTRPSHASIFTGLYPFEHGIHDNVAPELNKKIPTLAQLLQKRGYRTAAFVSSFVVNSQSGLNRGFDLYEDRFHADKQPTSFALSLEKRADLVYEEFEDWFKKRKSGSYFAWVHLYDPHFPYEAPEPYRSQFASRPYDGEVAYTDSQIAKFLKLVGDSALVILTSDHGESLGDHGENAHSFFIYDATLHVPLIFRWKGTLSSNVKIPHQVRLIDLFPTILELAGAPAPKVTGASLKPWLTTPSKPDPGFSSYSETYTPWLHFGWSRLVGLRQDGWKYIEAPRPELYYLQTDRGEIHNIIQQQRNRAARMKQWLIDSGALEASKMAQSSAPMDPETLEKLASLGYAGVGEPPPLSGNFADPKDKIEDFKLFNRLIREGMESFREERFQEAATAFQRLKERNLPSFEVHYYLGRSLLRLKSYDKARRELEVALRKLPHFLPAYRDLAECWEEMGKPVEAEKALLAGLIHSPNNPTLVHPLAWLYQRQKKYDAAEAILTAELKEHPTDVESRYRLGAIYRDTGRTRLAIDQFQQIVASKNDEAEAHNQLGMLYGAQKRWNDAIDQFKTAARLAPQTRIYQQNLQLAKSKIASRTARAVKFRIIQTPSRAAAEVLLRRLQSGADWETMAKEYSLHPSARSEQPVLNASASDLEPKLAKALNALSPGQTSGVVETPAGFFILRKE